MTITQDKIKTFPLLRALVPLVVGIVAGAFVGVPVWVWTVATLACGAMAWAGQKHNISTLYIHLTILLFGAALAAVHVPKQVIPQGQRVWIEALITDNPTYRAGRSARTSAIVGRWRPDSENSEWHRSGERLLVSFDTMYRFEAGDRVVFRSYVNPVSDTVGSYSRLMRARGYTGRTYISRYSHVVVAPAKASGLTAGIRIFQAGASSRLQKLALSPDEMAVAEAMTTGDRRGITSTLRQNYSRTGASHLLAVSGLHVGIVFLIINVLLYLLPLARRGHIAKNIVAVVAIWAYAVMVGLAPSVVRAAVMFTGAQLALATSSARNGVNIMAGTAFVMLAVKPLWLFDISFQLSFIAVVGIMAWFPPLYRLVESRWRGLNALWGVLLVSAVASVATMPLVSHTFGIFSPAGIVINPIIITTAYIVVAFSLVWIIVPIPLFAPVFRWIVGGAAWLQNKTVELVGAVPRATVEWQMPTWAVFVIYGAMIIFTAWLASRPTKETPFELPR
jgi:competence protein ComEC